jgi:hypothetical protein
MVKKLISSLTKKIGWRLAAKAALASLALGFLTWAGVSFWPVLIFLCAMLAIYLSESPERRVLRSSFWLLSMFSILGIAAVSLLPGYFLIDIMAAFLILFFGISLFLVFGLTNVFFKNKVLVYNLLNAAVLVYFFLLAFYLTPDPSGKEVFNFILWFLAIFLGSRLIMKETLIVNGSPENRNLKITVWSFSLIIAEIAVFAAILPLGFVDAAAFLTLFSVLGRDVILARLNGSLNLYLVFREVTIFVVVLSLIFATVTWILP